jgi:DNA-binding transcriptional LysR family regulator
MDLFQAMTVYVKVVETGSMTAAAQACEMSSTMVGNHLRALELRLGMSLLKRSTRRQSLTEFGMAYYQRCIEVLGMVADSERLAEQAQAEPRGTLRVTAPPTFGGECLVPALGGFFERYPQVKVDVVLTDRVVDLIGDGFDAAIRLGTLEPSSLIARPLQDYRSSVYAAPAYLARRGSPLHPQDLQQHDCLAFSYPAGTEWSWSEKHWRMTGAEGEVSVQVNGTLLINSASGLRQAALAGMGVVMLPDVLVRQDLAEGKLVKLLSDYQPPSRPLHLLYGQDRYRSPKLRGFVDYLVGVLGK